MLSRRAALTCVVALAVVACEDDLCTQSGCVFQDPWIFVVDEGTASGALRPGDYAFTVEAGEFLVEWSCTVAADDPQSSACNKYLVEQAEVAGDVLVDPSGSRSGASDPFPRLARARRRRPP